MLLALGIALAASGCAGDEREWMKVSEKYTTAEFRRDYAACSRGGRLDDACMRSRGWVDVSPGKESKPTEPEVRQPLGGGGFFRK